jgi:hypothetical protein
VKTWWIIVLTPLKWVQKKYKTLIIKMVTDSGSLEVLEPIWWIYEILVWSWVYYVFYLCWNLLMLWWNLPRPRMFLCDCIVQKKYKTLIIKMVIDSGSLEVARTNLVNLWNIGMILGLLCILPMLEFVNALMKFA